MTQTISRRKVLAGMGATLGTCFLPSTGHSAAPVKPKKTEFKYCLNTSTLRGQKLGIVKELETAAKAGFDGVEIWINSLEEYMKGGGTLKDLKSRIDDLGITIEDAIGFAQWIVDDETVRKQALAQLEKEMDMLAQIGCMRIAAPPAGATDKPGLDLTKAAERYRTILELGDKTGVIPQLEVWGFSQNLNRLAQVAYIVIESGHPKARILPDVYHLYKGGSSIEGLKVISGQTIEVFHLNDYPASPKQAEIDDSFRVYPGDGVGPVSQVLTYLNEAGGKKVLSLELFNKDYWQQEPLKVAQTGLQKMKDAVAKAV